MPETRLSLARFLPLSIVLFACGGAEAGAPTPLPVTPAQPAASAAPSSSEGPATAPVASTSAAPPAPPAPGDGAWPFGPAPSTEDKAAQLERLKKDAGPIKTNWVPPGKADRYGHAEGMVAASPDTLRAKIGDFAHYKDLAGPKFKTVKVVDKQGQATDVYFQLPIMKGLVTIWYVTRFNPVKASPAGDVVEGTYVKGNIKGMNIAFTVRPGPDARNSVLVCDLVLQPTVPAPQSALDEELRDACGDAIQSVRRTIAAP